MSSSSSTRYPRSFSKNATRRTTLSESSCNGSFRSVTGGKEPRLLSIYSASFRDISIVAFSLLFQAEKLLAKVPGQGELYPSAAGCGLKPNRYNLSVGLKKATLSSAVEVAE